MEAESSDTEAPAVIWVRPEPVWWFCGAGGERLDSRCNGKETLRRYASRLDVDKITLYYELQKPIFLML